MSGFYDGAITDDLDIAYNPDDYNDQASPAPPNAGNYTFKLKSLKPRKTKEGELVLRDGRWPVYVIEQVDIVEPSELARGVGLFQDISCKPYDRQGKPAFDVADFIRSVDQSRALVGLQQIDETVAEFAQTGPTFRGRLDWTAYDSAYVKAALDEIGLAGLRYADMNDEQKKAANAVYRKAKLTGQKRFIADALKRGASERVAHLWLGPSGETVEARPKIVQFYPSLEDVRLIQVAA